MVLDIDKTLVLKISQNDYVAFKSVFNKYYKDLVIRSNQILRDEQLSKDAAQEVFLELWKNRNKLPNSIVLEPYLRRSVINRSLNIIKSRSHHMGAGPKPLTLVKEKRLQPDEESELKELKQVITKCINNLPEKCRIVYMMCRQEGQTHKQVAEQLGISTKTIENQITKALKMLRNAVQEYQTESLILFIMSTAWGILRFNLLVL